MYFVLILIDTIYLFEISCFLSPLVRVFHSGRGHGGAPPHLTIYFEPLPPKSMPPPLKNEAPHLKNKPPSH